jgi:hypothetical protein
MPLLVRERPRTVLGISAIGFDVDAGGGVDGSAIDLSQSPQERLMRSIKAALRDLKQRRSGRQAERATTRGERAQRDAEAKARFREYQRSSGGHREGGDPGGAGGAAGF